MERLLELLAQEHGVLVRREQPALTRQLDYGVRTGQLRAILPGIYTLPEPTWEVRIRAAADFRPGCVFTGATEAMLLWWPQVPIAEVSAAIRHTVRPAHPGFAWQRRTIPPDLTIDREQLRIARPAVSVLDLVPVLGGAVIDEALRRRMVTLHERQTALEQLPFRALNVQRRMLLDDSRDEPWSEPERDAHRLLRAAGFTGFRTNHPIDVKGVRYWVDIAFLRERVVIEIDGWKFHKSRQSFGADRWRYAKLAADNWKVLPFDSVAVTDQPDEFIGVVRTALEST